MKKYTFFLAFIFLAGAACCQDQAQSYDSSFKALYKAVALHPGRLDREGQISDSKIKRWDKDIVIFVEGGSGKSRKNILSKLKNTIAVISPALDNKIKISFTNDKALANYLIDLDFTGRNGWYIKWDGFDNIYSCMMLINTEAVFNFDEQAGLVSHYFLKSLGDFVFIKEDNPVFNGDTSVASNISVWRQDINSVDLRILRLNYSDDIKPGMAEKDIDLFFDRHDN